MNDSATFYMYQANLGRQVLVFGWDKAASMIAERKPERAMAGLAEDFECTRGTIYKDGKPVDKEGDGTYTILASTWATPILVMDGEEVECWKMESEANGWEKYTCWPESALKIFWEV